MKRICVFCGSHLGLRPEYAKAARYTGRILAEAGLGLVYGGGSVGMMGEIASATLAAGGEVIGIIPRTLLNREIPFDGLTSLHIVDSMHERKALMARLADGFIALPGGLGTFEEFLEVLTWAQLGMHRKPCGLLNVGGYFGRLIDFITHALEEGFIKPEHRAILIVEKDPRALLQRFTHYHAPVVKKWISGRNV